MAEPSILERVNAILVHDGRGVVRHLEVHDYDQSIELFLEPDVPVGWMPSEAMLKAVAALGYLTVYCDFKDDTEFIGAWRRRTELGRPVAGGEYWVMSPRREKVGCARWRAG